MKWRSFSTLMICAAMGCNGGEDRTFEFMPREQAVDLINENNSEVGPRFKSKGRFHIHFEWDGQVVDASGQMKLQSSPDGHLSIVGTKDLVGDLFDLGCNHERYWLWQKYPDDQDRMWIGIPGAAVKQHMLPINPQGLMDALGTQPLDDLLVGPDAPRYRVTPEFHQLLYEKEADGVPYIHKELWLGRSDPHMIERVLYRGLDGRVILDARLADHRPITEGGPWVAHHVKLETPMEGNTLEFKLKSPYLKQKPDSIYFVDPGARQDVNPMFRVGPVEEIWVTDKPAEANPS
jgi:hypothetical protein